MPVVEEKQARPEMAGLMEALLNGDTYSSLQAAGELAKIGAPAVDPLVQVLSDSGTHSRWSVAMALARVGSPAVEALIEAMKTEHDPVRNPAVWALAEIGDSRAVEPLIAVMRSGGSECCRALTAAALLKIGHPAGVAAVREDLRTADDVFREMVSEATRDI
ncbi:MAG: HEAT repeat domain-containing protein [Methanomicrobiaceae archaeon]|nr:HEAT repeat domain-containing protein [Methanomicrobiaceae archaeon]